MALTPSPLLGAAEASAALQRGEALEGRVGGKALGLARLGGAGAQVPPWCVVTAEAFAAHLQQGALQAQLQQALEGLRGLDLARELPELERRAAALRALIEAAPLDPTLAEALAAQLPGLGAGLYAVRSSMVGEDSQSHSFAGQLDTFLFQRAADVPGALVRCWASAFTARALSYRARSGDLTALPRVGVVVQRMLTGRVSGVMFTRNPVNGRADQALISACWGAGEGVVSGRCNADELVWSHGGQEVSCTITDKDLQVVAHPDGAPGTEEAPVPEALRKARCLTPTEAGLLVQEGLRVAAALGGPQDLEWTFVDEGLFLLQARPITASAAAALPPQAVGPEPGGPVIVWDNSNIQESYCGVTTPLTFSFARGAYANVYEQVMRIARLPEPEIAAQRPVLQNLLGLLSGRVYYNINNWYRMLQHLPSFQRNKGDMEKMMGLEEPVDFVTDEALGLGQKLARLPRLLSLGVRMALHFRRMDAEVEAFMRGFDQGYQRVAAQRQSFPSATFSELMGHLAFVRAELLGRWHVPLVNDIYVMISSGRLRRLLERAVGPAEAPRLLANLMGGEEGIESTEPTRMLLRMSAAARTRPDLLAALQRPDSTLADLQRGFPDFAAQLGVYIERYGDRCMGELKLETVSLREDPSFLLRLLRNYVERGDLDADAIAQKEKHLRAEAEAELARHLPPHRTRSVLRAARSAVKYRENMRLLRTRLFGLVRDLYRAIGDRLHQAGRLDHPRDVFYLTVEEIDSYHGGTAVSADTAALARARKGEYAGYQALELAHRIETVGPVYHGNNIGATAEPEAGGAVDAGARLLRGTGCYPGVVEAPGRVILSPTDDIALSGKILVTLRTDPGWAPLFPLARGILVERGSTLSHSAILARELGIPAIVGVPDLLRIVRDGDLLRLDGAKGTVERLEKE